MEPLVIGVYCKHCKKLFEVRIGLNKKRSKCPHCRSFTYHRRLTGEEIIGEHQKCDGECQKAKDMESALDDLWRWLEDTAREVDRGDVDADVITGRLMDRAGMIKRALGY